MGKQARVHSLHRERARLVAPATLPDALSRNVYCILGIPIDAITMSAVLRRIELAASADAPFVISTPNLNFLVTSQSDVEFRETLLFSDLCPADGVPILWIARLIGAPIEKRVAGSDIFDALKARRSSKGPLKIFLFGGAEGAAAAASRALNGRPGGLRCVGTLNPGFCSVEDMSGRDIIDAVNASGADFLVASLGARKGQLWLQRNFHRLLIPIRAHLGAALNFQAGTLKRAPHIIRKCGLEWLWRIKEEPHLWQRYLHDGTVLLRLLLARALPLAIWSWYQKLTGLNGAPDFAITHTQADDSVTLRMHGSVTAVHVDSIIPAFRAAIATRKRIIIDFSGTHSIDARFLGLLLMLRKVLKGGGTTFLIAGLSSRLEIFFRLNGLGFVLSESRRLPD
jgi:N-acetylglucosaminyldiphosphoundecaprenol N-acetyl-beta-D-mannosaminyltransferase